MKDHEIIKRVPFEYLYTAKEYDLIVRFFAYSICQISHMSVHLV